MLILKIVSNLFQDCQKSLHTAFHILRISKPLFPSLQISEK